MSKSKQNNNQPYLQLEKQKKKTKASLCESCHTMQAMEKQKAAPRKKRTTINLCNRKRRTTI